jgi:hypothetical protein
LTAAENDAREALRDLEDAGVIEVTEVGDGEIEISLLPNEPAV